MPPLNHHPRGPRNPLHPDISEAMVKELVHHFYGKVRTNPDIGPIFNTAIADNWPKHLARMCSFWNSIALKTGEYKGKPVPKHKQLPNLTPDHFKTWLSLFRISAHEVCGKEIGAAFIDQAERIAESLQLACFFQDQIAPPGIFQNGEFQPSSHETTNQ